MYHYSPAIKFNNGIAQSLDPQFCDQDMLISFLLWKELRLANDLSYAMRVTGIGKWLIKPPSRSSMIMEDLCLGTITVKYRFFTRKLVHECLISLQHGWACISH